MPQHADLKSYYRILGVPATASSEEIKRAYRKLALEMHPDRNLGDPTATAKFQKLSEAYALLSEPEKRAKYDAACLAGEESNTIHRQADPIKCSVCGAISAQPRYIIFWYVISLVYWTSRRAIQGVFCHSCASKKALKASAISWLLGWWGFPMGILWTFEALYKNLLNGTQPADVNGHILGQQGVYFWEHRNPDLASAVVEQALHFKCSPSLRESLIKFKQAIPSKLNIPLVDRWKLTRCWVFWVQLVPIFSVIGLITWSFHDNILVSISQQKLAHVADVKTQVFTDPHYNGKVIATVRPFQNFNILVDRGTTGFERIITNHQTVGYIPKSSVIYGDGQTDLRERCFPFGEENFDNGKIFLQRELGHHTIKTQNGLSSDAVVKLRDTVGHTVLSYYVKAHNQITIDSIPEGTYTIEFATGNEYSSTCGYFLSNMSSQRFLEATTFETKYRLNGYSTSILEITLNPVANGNARTISTDDSNFDRD